MILFRRTLLALPLLFLISCGENASTVEPAKSEDTIEKVEATIPNDSTPVELPESDIENLESSIIDTDNGLIPVFVEHPNQEELHIDIDDSDTGNRSPNMGAPNAETEEVCDQDEGC